MQIFTGEINWWLAATVCVSSSSVWHQLRTRNNRLANAGNAPAACLTYYTHLSINASAGIYRASFLMPTRCQRTSATRSLARNVHALMTKVLNRSNGIHKMVDDQTELHWQLKADPYRPISAYDQWRQLRKVRTVWREHRDCGVNAYQRYKLSCMQKNAIIEVPTYQQFFWRGATMAWTPRAKHASQLKLHPCTWIIQALSASNRCWLRMM